MPQLSGGTFFDLSLDLLLLSMSFAFPPSHVRSQQGSVFRPQVSMSKAYEVTPFDRAPATQIQMQH
jgi:hypothetical protein